MNFITIDSNLTFAAEFKKSSVNLKRADDVFEIVEGMYIFWPVTVRSVYYKVISDERYTLDHWRSQKGRNKGGNLENPEEQIGDILKYLRLSKKLSWNAINDDSRIVTRKRGSSDYDKHLIHQFNTLCIAPFDRCNAADQENYIEVWVEKNGLVHIVESVADEFCRRVAGCKGFPSVSFLHQYSLRADRAAEKGQNCKILYFGDLDPSGWLIPKTIAFSLYYEHDTIVEVIRCGLNPSDIEPGMQSIPLKGKKPIKDEFMYETDLDVGYELDLLDPKDLQNRVRDAISRYTDFGALYKAETMAKKNNAAIHDINIEIKEALTPIIDKYK